MTTDNAIKKKIMFSKGDDFYFLSYNLILILYALECFCGKRNFRDYRKLAFLIDFISNRNLVNVISRYQTSLNAVNKEQMTRAYANGLLRMSQFVRLLFTLEKMGFVKLDRDKTTNVVSICLDKEKIPAGFVDKELFSLEFQNLELLKKSIKKLNQSTLDSLLQRLFDNHGVKRWVSY